MNNDLQILFDNVFYDMIDIFTKKSIYKSNCEEIIDYLIINDAPDYCKMNMFCSLACKNNNYDIMKYILINKTYDCNLYNINQSTNYHILELGVITFAKNSIFKDKKLITFGEIKEYCDNLGYNNVLTYINNISDCKDVANRYLKILHNEKQ